MSDLLERLQSVLSDRYTVERELGRGGMAVVYLAEDGKHHRPVAIKVLQPELAAVLGPERFLREIEITARLTHPHILPLLDSGEADGLLYYVMPYVEGESLRERLEQEKQLPLEEALRIAAEAADALSFAHGHDVLHRDIKPENILLEGGHAVVADFGLARAITVAGGTRLTDTGMAVGTPEYMSPEQAAGDRELDARSDVYSLGCVLYEMLAGEPPFTGPTIESVARQHLTAAPPDVTTLRATVSPSISQSIVRALAKAPADRFASAAQFAETIAPAAALTVSAAPARRRRVMVGAVLGVAVAIIAIAALASIPGGGTAALNPRYVVVAPFRNATGDPSLEYLGERIGHWITQGIQQAAVPVTPWDQALQSWDYVQTEAEAGRVRDPVHALAEETGAGLVVSGAVYPVGGDSLEAQASVTDATEGRLVGAVEPLRAARTEESALIAAQQQRVMVFLAPRFEEQVRDVVPPDVIAAAPTYEAYRAYKEGLRLHGQRKWADAIPYFRRAFEPECTWAAPLFRLAPAFGNLGRWAERDSVVKILEGLWDRLTPYERAELQARQAGRNGDLRQELEAFRRAAELGPSRSTRVNLAWALSKRNYPHEARDLLLTIEPEPVVLLFNTHLMLDEREQALETTRKCRRLTPESRTCLVLQTYALAALGHLEELAVVADELEAMPEVSLAPWETVNYLAFLRHYVGVEATQDFAERAVRWAETRPSEQSSTLDHRINYGRALYYAGRLDDAQRVLDAAIDAESRRGRTTRRALNSVARALVSVARGDTAQALRDAEWIERHAETLEGRERERERLWYRGIIYGIAGERARAMELFRQYERFWDYRPFNLIVFLEPMRGYPPFEEFIRPKG